MDDVPLSSELKKSGSDAQAPDDLLRSLEEQLESPQQKILDNSEQAEGIKPEAPFFSSESKKPAAVAQSQKSSSSLEALNVMPHSESELHSVRKFTPRPPDKSEVVSESEQKSFSALPSQFQEFKPVSSGQTPGYPPHPSDIRPKPQAESQPFTMSPRAGSPTLDFRPTVKSQQQPYRETFQTDTGKGSEKEITKEEGGIPKLRTFKSDAWEFVKKKGVSLTSIAAQKEERRERPQRRPEEGSKKKIVAALVFILLFGGGALFYFSRISTKEVNGPQVELPKGIKVKPPEALYPTSESYIIKGRNSPPDFLNPWRALFARTIPDNSLLPVYVFSETQSRYLSAKEWFGFVEIQLPFRILKTVKDPWTLGLFSIAGRYEPLFIIPVGSFEEGFKGMLDWEGDLPFVFRNIFPADHPKRNFERFEDVIIANQNVRLLKTTDGQTLFAYTFFDRRILVMSSSDKALEAVLNRFLIAPPLIGK